MRCACGEIGIVERVVLKMPLIDLLHGLKAAVLGQRGQSEYKCAKRKGEIAASSGSQLSLVAVNVLNANTGTFYSSGADRREHAKLIAKSEQGEECG